MASSDADVVTRVRQRVGEALQRQRALRSRCSVVVGVSGGADSLCLLDALVAVVPRARKRLFVGHVDHQLRPNSANDAGHVRAVSDAYGLRCEVVTVDVPALSSYLPLGVEAAARFARYHALQGLVGHLGADFVATGHTTDDSVETTLMHLVRGSGLRGLAGIPELRRMDVYSLADAADSCATRSQRRTELLLTLRPLLNVTRADTQLYCEARGIRWLTDETNADPRFTRNRIRSHLLPVLRTYNPAVDQSLLRMAETVRDEDAWLDTVANGRLRRLLRDTEDRAALESAGWRRQPLPIQRRIVRLMAESLGHREIGFEAVERALAVGMEDGPPRAELGGGMTVERRGDTLFFIRTQRERHE